MLDFVIITPMQLLKIVRETAFGVFCKYLSNQRITYIIYSGKLDNTYIRVLYSAILRWDRHRRFSLSTIRIFFNVVQQTCANENVKSDCIIKTETPLIPVITFGNTPFSLSWTFLLLYTASNVSKYGIFSGPYFPIFGLNTDQKKFHIWTLLTQC